MTNVGIKDFSSTNHIVYYLDNLKKKFKMICHTTMGAIKIFMQKLVLQHEFCEIILQTIRFAISLQNCTNNIQCLTDFNIFHKILENNCIAKRTVFFNLKKKLKSYKYDFKN